MATGTFNRRDFIAAASLGATEIGLATRGTPAFANEAKACYFPFHCKPATVIDFGLSSEQEERAKELHSKLYIFDGEPEVDFFEGLYGNILSGKVLGLRSPPVP